jgi:PAS domain S-box-containing protein
MTELSADRWRSDEELRASEAKFAGILAIAADAIITIDDTYRIIHFNHGAEEIFGYDAAEAIGQPLSILLPERFRNTHDAQIRAFGESAENARRMGHRQAIPGRRKNGGNSAEASISKLVSPRANASTRWCPDITERKWSRIPIATAESGTRLARSLQQEAVLDAIGGSDPMLGDACVIDGKDTRFAGSLRRWIRSGSS